MGFRPAARPGHPYLAGAPTLVAHRGGAGLAPENTLEAFRLAVQGYDADILELQHHLGARVLELVARRNRERRGD